MKAIGMFLSGWALFTLFMFFWIWMFTGTIEIRKTLLFTSGLSVFAYLGFRWVNWSLE